MAEEFPNEIWELIFMHLLHAPRFNLIISKRFLKSLKFAWNDDSGKKNFEASTRSFDGVVFKNINGVSPIMERFMKKNVHLHKNIMFFDCQFSDIEIFDLQTVVKERLESICYQKNDRNSKQTFIQLRKPIVSFATVSKFLSLFSTY